ncbi:MAG: hypothetical protein ACFE0J_23750 [Elainellaceae cyanobacterium]
MDSSLQSRFRGALMGAAIGQLVGDSAQSHLSSRWMAQGLPRRLSPFDSIPSTVNDSDINDSEWSRVAVDLIHVLIGGTWGQANVDRMPDTARSPAPDSSSSQSDAEFPISLEQVPSPIRADGLAIATLPLALFFQDDDTVFQARFEQVMAAWQVSSWVQAATRLWLDTLILALREQSPADHLIYLLQDRHSNTKNSLTLNEGLLVIKDLMKQHIGATRALTILREWAESRCLSSNSPTSEAVPPAIYIMPIMGSLYEFFTAADEPQLALYRLSHALRQANEQSHRPMMAMLMGSLMGAYHGDVKLPLEWQWAIAQWGVEPSSTKIKWGGKKWLDIIELADQLFAAWIGVEQPKIIQTLNLPIAIAHPRIISP